VPRFERVRATKIPVANHVEATLKTCHDEEPSCHVGLGLEKKFSFQLSKNIFAVFGL
jgi:hypothetical protein